MKKPKAKTKTKQTWIEWRILWRDGTHSAFTHETRKEAITFAGGPGNRGKAIKVRVEEC